MKIRNKTRTFQLSILFLLALIVSISLFTIQAIDYIDKKEPVRITLTDTQRQTVETIVTKHYGMEKTDEFTLLGTYMSRDEYLIIIGIANQTYYLKMRAGEVFDSGVY